MEIESLIKNKYFVISSLFLLALSIAVNLRLYVMWTSSHDDVYDLIGKSYINDQRILSEIESGNISIAEEMLRREIEISGNIITICAIEKCSKSIVGIGSAKP